MSVFSIESRHVFIKDCIIADDTRLFRRQITYVLLYAGEHQAIANRTSTSSLRWPKASGFSRGRKAPLRAHWIAMALRASQ
jgi:hypothetical protein